MNKFFHWLIYLAAVLFLMQSQPAVADQELEYKIKAAIIRKLPAFVSWPQEYSPLKSHTVNVCLYGESAIAMQNATIEKHDERATVTYHFLRLGSLSDAASRCHMVFIGQSETSHLGDVLAKLRTSPVLTISDIDNFAQSGGMVGFQLIDNKVRYNVNNSAFGKAGLKVDAQLLEIANIVIQ